MQQFREIGSLKHLYRNELDKACFTHHATYSDSKDLAKRTISDKTLRNRAYEIARNRNYDGYQRASASMVYKFFDKKTGLGINVKKQLAEELHKPVTKKFKRIKVYARFQDNIWEQIQLKWNHCLQRIKMLKDYYVSQMFSLNMHGLDLEK